MKNLIVTVILALTAASAQAELSVVTMPLTGTNSHISKFEPADTFEADGLLVRTTDGKNECLITSRVLKSNNVSAVEFNNYLKKLNVSKEQFLLSCYTERGEVIQAVVTQSK